MTTNARIYFRFVKTVGFVDKNDKIIWSYPIFLIRNVYLISKNIVHVKLQPRMQALVTSRLGWRLKSKLFVLMFNSTCDWPSVPVVSWTRAWNPTWKSFSDAAICPWEMHVLYNPDGVVKYSVIHRLQLINSAQLCNKKFQSIRWSRYHLLCLHLQAVLISVILEISSMSLNSEASHVSFLNQTLLQTENYIKMDNLPSNAMFRYVLIFSERKWLYFIVCLNMIVKHEFGLYFKTCICFRTEATSH